MGSRTDLAQSTPGKFPVDTDYENLEGKSGMQPEEPDYPDPYTDDNPESSKSGKNDYYEGILFSDGLPKPGSQIVAIKQ